MSSRPIALLVHAAGLSGNSSALLDNVGTLSANTAVLSGNRGTLSGHVGVVAVTVDGLSRNACVLSGNVFALSANAGALVAIVLHCPTLLGTVGQFFDYSAMRTGHARQAAACLTLFERLRRSCQPPANPPSP